LFLKFEKGGKMVATCGGAFLGVAWLVGLIGATTWIIVFLLTRYASVASLVAAVALPTAAVALGEPWPVIAFATVSGVAVIVLHRANVKRLLRGEENRFTWPRGNRTARA
jgi:glycerol-3-phosphate acyltransferase PlsY